MSRSESIRLALAIAAVSAIFTLMTVCAAGAQSAKDSTAGTSPSASSQATNLAGSWRCVGRKGTASIHQKGDTLSFVNEWGGKSRGHWAGSDTVIADDWEGGLHGKISPDGATISWANNTTWKRIVPKPVAQGAARPATQAPPELVNLAGAWECIGRPGSASIQQNGKKLIFKNEAGSVSSGHFAGKRTVVADNWENGLKGTVSADGKRISWANNTTWVKSSKQ